MQKELAEIAEKHLLKKSQDLVQIIDANGNFLWANEKWRKKMGYQLPEIKKMNVREVIHPDYLKKCIKKLTEFQRNAVNSIIEVIFLSKQGNLINLEGKISSAKIADSLVFVCCFQDVSKQKELLNEKKRFLAIFDGMNAGIWDYNVKTESLLLDKKSCEILGYQGKKSYQSSREEFMNLIHPDDRYKVNALVETKEKRDYYQEEVRINYQGNSWRWILIKTRLADRENFPWLIGVVIDVTERRDLEEQLFMEKELFRTTLFSVGDGVISTDKTGRVILMNKKAEELTGFCKEEAMGQSVDKIFNIIDSYLRDYCENFWDDVLKIEEPQKISTDTILIAKDGREIAIEETVAPIKDINGNTTGTVIVFKDISEKRAWQAEIEHLSFHDQLTGLYNRHYMDKILLQLDQEKYLPLGLMFIDVNGLKLTNDAFGHDKGDLLLKKVAEVLKECVHKNDFVCRIGGDEYIVIMPNTNKEKVAQLEKSILAKISTEKIESVNISLAIGAAIKEKSTENIRDIKITADKKMYKHKVKTGRIMRSEIIERVIRSINENYEQEQIHTEKVAFYCEKMAEKLNFSSKEMDDIKMAAVLHDIGKITVPSELLQKKEKLTKEEKEAIKKHAEVGYQMLKAVTEYSFLAEYVLYHHERWDGKGYPHGLKGEEIPLQSRIIAIADAFEAMIAERPYQKSKTKEEAIADLQKESGKQFDSKLVEIFIEYLKTDN